VICHMILCDGYADEQMLYYPQIWGSGTEITSTGTYGDGDRVERGRLGRISILRGRMGENVRPRAGL